MVFFFWGGGAVEGSGGIFGGEVLGPGLGRGGRSGSVGIFVGRGNWVGGRGLGWGCFRWVRYLGRGSGLGGVCRSFGVG